MIYFWNVIWPPIIAILIISVYVLFRERQILKLKLELKIAKSIIEGIKLEIKSKTELWEKKYKKACIDYEKSIALMGNVISNKNQKGKDNGLF